MRRRTSSIAPTKSRRGTNGKWAREKPSTSRQGYRLDDFAYPVYVTVGHVVDASRSFLFRHEHCGPGDVFLVHQRSAIRSGPDGNERAVLNCPNETMIITLHTPAVHGGKPQDHCARVNDRSFTAKLRFGVDRLWPERR
jgi:hypothetical protein